MLSGKAVIVDGEMEIVPGVKIHPAFRAHTAGSQLLEVPTRVGKLVFGSDAYSSWEAHPRLDDRESAADRHGAAVPGLREVLQDHRRLSELRRRHEPLSYTDKYPLTKNSWVGINGSRMAEIALAAGETSRKPR